MDLSKLSNEEYGRYVGEKEKTSPLWKDLIWAFCVGGLICVGGQALSELYQSWGLSKDDAGTWVSITLVFLAALLLGTGARLFTVAGPVLAYGIGASVIYGLILWVMGLF